MTYSLSSDKSWNDTKADLRAMFDKWGVPQYWITGEASRRNKWGGYDYSEDPERRRVTITFLHPTGREVTVTMDTQPHSSLNLRAIYLCLDDLRMIEKRGLADTMRDTLLQLAPPPDPNDPFAVLGVKFGAPRDEVEAKFRELAKQFHPDRGGDTATMARLLWAINTLRGRWAVKA